MQRAAGKAIRVRHQVGDVSTTVRAVEPAVSAHRSDWLIGRSAERGAAPRLALAAQKRRFLQSEQRVHRVQQDRGFTARIVAEDHFMRQAAYLVENDLVAVAVQRVHLILAGAQHEAHVYVEVEVRQPVIAMWRRDDRDWDRAAHQRRDEIELADDRLSLQLGDAHHCRLPSPLNSQSVTAQ